MITYNTNFKELNLFNISNSTKKTKIIKSKFYDTHNKLTLKDAEILVLMRTRGKLLRSYISKNIINETIYYIITQEKDYIKTFLIDSDGELILVQKDNF